MQFIPGRRGLRSPFHWLRQSTCDILLFFRHREPSGLVLALREAIPHSWNENKVHSVIHEKGAASYPTHWPRQPRAIGVPLGL